MKDALSLFKAAVALISKFSRKCSRYDLIPNIPRSYPFGILNIYTYLAISNTYDFHFRLKSTLHKFT